MMAYLKDTAEAGGLANPEQLAQQLMVLFDSTIVTAQVSGPGNIDGTKQIAETLIRSAEAQN